MAAVAAGVPRGWWRIEKLASMRCYFGVLVTGRMLADLVLDYVKLAHFDFGIVADLVVP